MQFDTRSLEDLGLTPVKEGRLRMEFDEYINKNVNSAKLNTPWGDFEVKPSIALDWCQDAFAYEHCYYAWLDNLLDEGEYIQVGDGIYLTKAEYLLLISAKL